MLRWSTPSYITIKERREREISSTMTASNPLPTPAPKALELYSGKCEFTGEVYSIYIDRDRDFNLSEAGRIKLKNDQYMLPHETSPQEAFARAAIAYASNNEMAQRLYDYASQCWFMFASPVLSSAANPRGLPISCLADGSKILTKDRGFVNIEDLKVGEKVLTHLGNWKPVVAKQHRLAHEDEMYALVVDKRRTKTLITGNHPVLTDKGWVRVDELDPSSHKVKIDNHISTKEIPHVISLTDHVSYDFKVINNEIVATRTRFSQDFDRQVIRHKEYYGTPKATVLVTDEVAWALGLWLAEGSLTTSRRGKPNGIRVTVSHDEMDLANRFMKIMEENFNVRGNIYTSELERNGKKNSWITVNINSVVLGNYFGNEFGISCKTKDIPGWVLDLPRSQRSALYEAFKLGDGSEQKNYNTIGLSNHKLIGTMYCLALSLGKDVSIKMDTKAGKLSTVDFVSTMVEYFNHKVEEFQPIVSLTKLDEAKRVWDIQVKDDESFSVNGFIVHNCFLSMVPDSREGIGESWKEMLWLSTEGGGIGSDWSSVRSVGTATSRGTYTPGLIPFLKAVDAITLASIQGGVRRGATAVYLDVSHPEIEEFIESRRATGRDESRTLVNLHNAVNIPDSFMEAVKANKSWDLIDPSSKEVRKTVPARKLWERILEVRSETGEPYIHFIDTSNKALPQPLKDKGLRINNSNLCSEIFLPTAPDRTAVCCLSSVNIEFFDDWSVDPQFIPDMIEMLDNVLEVFIKKAPPELHKAVYSATMERSLGLGTMGFHLYLQKRGIAFESPMASGQNRRIFGHIHSKAVAHSKELAKQRGQAPDMQGTGMRNAHLIAIAPNATSGILCNTSPSIEPINANIFVQKTRSGAFIMKNKELDRVLIENYGIKGTAYDKVWNNILAANGSVQGLDFLSEHDKQVFKTAMELDQQWVVDHAATRQPFICQGQSVNLFFNDGTSKSVVHKIHMQAWEKGLKSLYYLRFENPGKFTNTSTTNNQPKYPPSIPLSENASSGCLSCEG